MSPGELFALGCAGGFVAYVALYVAPELKEMRKTKDFNPPRGVVLLVNIVGFLGYAAVMCGLGGVAAWLFGGDTTTAKHAFLLGIGGETTVAAVAQQGARVLERLGG